MPNGFAYPIIYVRGFAGGTSGIDTAADDPFYGFNDGATHVRVNGDGNPQFYQFEGPLVRLMEDEDYRVPVHGNQHAYLNQSASGSQPRTSVWIYRFYDPDADTFGAAAVPYDLPTAARNLLAFVKLVLAKTDFTGPDGNPGEAKVWLVAHSMGGLICRSMIQKMCPDNGIAPGDLVDKLFTYATPHNGIDFGIFGLNIGVPQIAPFDAQIFNRKVMYQYLTPAAGLQQSPDMPAGWDAHVITGLDPSRVFCLIGTNAADYGAVSKAVGPKSDGLVQIDNAYVRGASRTFVHRSHSGRYGEVNSEEGYQNLRRFLFGTRKATVRLVNATLPAATSPGVLDVWQAEVSVSIRGLPVLHRRPDGCPLLPGRAGQGSRGRPARRRPGARRRRGNPGDGPGRQLRRPPADHGLPARPGPGPAAAAGRPAARNVLAPLPLRAAAQGDPPAGAARPVHLAEPPRGSPGVGGHPDRRRRP